MGPPGASCGTDPIDHAAQTPLDRRMERLEEQIAHLTRALDDLSETVTRQEREIALLTRRVALLLEREAAREQDQGGGMVMGDERPPHW